jgi:hypothetical protein
VPESWTLIGGKHGFIETMFSVDKSPLFKPFKFRWHDIDKNNVPFVSLQQDYDGA